MLGAIVDLSTSINFTMPRVVRFNSLAGYSEEIFFSFKINFIDQEAMFEGGHMR